MNKKTLMTALSLALSPNLWAQTEAQVLANELEISGLDDSQKYQLKLQLPNKQVKKLILEAASATSFTPEDFAIKEFTDGQYKYEMTPVSKTIKTRNEASIKSSSKNNKVLSGFFTVLNGRTFNEQHEDEYDRKGDDFGLKAAPISGDQTIRSSLCVGFDCVDTENYGSDTIRLKENNLRIKFDDTSATASFAANDWELTANSPDNGGLNFFGITDVTAGNVPFTVEAGAGSNALYIDDAGRLGLGTSTPVVDAHIVGGNTPAIRLEQDPSSGFGPQTWDMAGNETNFFIRDVTSSSNLPFRIRPGAPTSSIDIAGDGDVGIGTDTPTRRLHLRTATGSVGFQLEKGETNESWKFVTRGDDFQISKVGSGSAELEVTDSGEFLISDNLVMDSNGNVTIQGALTQNSDVNSKENIRLVNTAEILNKVMNLPVSIWNYKFDQDSVRHLGPMAQDFFKEFNLGSTEDKISSIDTSGVALASIKELGKQLANKDSEIKSLKTENQKLKSRLDKIEATLEHLK